MIRINPASNIHRAVFVLGIVCLLTSFASVIFVAARNDKDESTPNTVPPSSDAPARARIAEHFGRLPLSFEINKGQTDQSVKFLSRGSGYELFLTATDAVLRLRKPHALRTDNPRTAQTKSESEPEVLEGSVLRLRMIGANPAPRAEGQDELPGKVNYFIGNNPEKWFRNVPTYRKAYYTDVYPGIDMVYYGNQRQLEYDFVVAPGANPRLIRFRVEGADRLRLDKTGTLLVTLKHGEVRLNKPVIYQLDEKGGRREVKGTYVISGNEVRFKLETFDTSKPLVIDPVLSYQTLLGSGQNDSASGIAVDSQGSAYVTGRTEGTNFPTTVGAFKSTSPNGGGAFVTKLDPTGSSLVYSTYLSGTQTNTTGVGIAVDSSGNAHIIGTTSVTDFPIVNGLRTNSNFFKTTDAAANWNNQNSGLAGSVFAFAVAPSAPNTIYASTSDGIYRSTDDGTNWTKAPATGLFSNFNNTMAVDPSNSSVVYIGNSSGLFKSTNAGNNWTALNSPPLGFNSVFSVVFDPSTPSTIYVGTSNGVFKSTDSGNTWITQNNFGIPGTPNVHALAIDPTAPLTIYAGTFGNGFFKSTNGGGVWTAMNNGMGGGAPTSISCVVIDPSNPSTVYTGHSSGGAGGINKSIDGGTSWTPLTNGVPNVGIVAMVATSSAVYAAIGSGGGIIKTANGGSNWTNVNVGLWSTTVLCLIKHPTDASVIYAGTASTGTQDAFVTKLNSAGSGLLFSTLLGGSKDESGTSIAVDGTGNISVVGQTSSSNFPFVNAVRSTVTFNGSCGTGFVTKLNPAVPSYVFSTYLGGANCDIANSVATDSSGNIYVTGRTGSTDFPTANAFQPNFSGPQFSSDAFVTKLTTDGALIYSTYLGGTSGTGVGEGGFGIAADSSGNAYVTGVTESSSFPTMNPIKATLSGSNDAFVTKFNSQGSLVYSTYFGGGGIENARGIAVDSANNVYITGSSESLDFPLVAGALRTKSAMYKSLDGAATWSNDNYGFAGAIQSIFGGTSITGLAIHPTEPSTVYAASDAGVFKTTNGGRTWSVMNSGLTSRSVVAIAINPSAPSTLYVLVSVTGVPGVYGVYKSTDAGASWNLRSNGLPGGSTTFHGLAIDPVSPNTLYVGLASCCVSSRIYKSTDGADNWAPLPNAPPLFPTTLAIDPLNHLTIYAADGGSPGAIYKSIDAGATWQSLGSTVLMARSLSVSPLTPGLIYAHTDQALFRSVDGGSNWSTVNSRIGKIVFDPLTSSTLYLLEKPFTFDPQGLLKSTDNGQTWVAMNKGFNMPTVVQLAIDPVRPSTLYLVATPSNGLDAFVTKINPAGNGLVYSTFIGGPIDTQSFNNINASASAIAVDASGNAYITGATSSQRFPVTPNAYQPFNRGFNDAFISKLGMSYIIGGQVLNNGVTPLGGAEVVLNDGSSLTSVLTESDGSYQFSRLREGGTFTVSANKAHFTMAPASQTFSNLNSDQVLNFTATPSGSPFFTISGQITENGVALAGVTVTLSGSQSGLRTTDSNGNYSFELIGGGNYTVTPSILGFSFGPTNQTFNSLSGNQTANFAATRQNFVVTNANNHGNGSLRAAIINANATGGTDTIVFNIPGPGVKTISVLNALPEITERVVIDATTQPGYAGTPLVELDGLAIGITTPGLVIKAGGSTVRGLAIGNFRFENAISLNGSNNNIIQANYLGVAADGITARPNGRGIGITNSSNNVIGGTTAATRNVISGNGGGIDISGNANVVQGNFIGTNATGTAALPNAGGVSINTAQSTDNLIGGTAAGAGNLISGNGGTGVTASGTGTIIQGNLIGTDITGTNKIPNSRGVQALGTNTLIGGLTTGARNVISGNSSDGVFVRGAGNKVQGNYIGTDITGTLALGNNGVGVIAGDNALVGGTAPEARNIITASGNIANVALGQNSSGSAAIVQGNYIGTDVTGTRALVGSFVVPGVNVSSNNNLIGGLVAGARNVISGNTVGITMTGFPFSPVGNLIQGNFIGLNATGTGPLPNSQQGIAISEATNNTIGGTQSEAANKIAFNSGAGITISVGQGNAIRGNSIFSNNGLGIDLGANGVTANDLNDSDTGPNNLQNFPVISGVLSTSSSTTIQGSLNSFPNTTFQIDFYSNAAVDPSGNGEGAQFFERTSITTDGNGNATINVTFPIALASGRVITATATDPNGNTSEFSTGDASGAGGSVQFTVASIQVIEDIGLLNVTVVRSGGSVGNLTVDYSTSNGTATAGQDYTATSGTLTFVGGETSKSFQVPIVDDAITEPSETFTVALGNTPNLESLGAPSTLLVTLQDRTTVPTVTLPNVVVTEGGPGTITQLPFTLNLSAATGRTVSVNFATFNQGSFGGSTCSTRGVDYVTTSGTITFQPGTTAIPIPVTVCGDTSAEANENVVVFLSNPVNATLPLTTAIGSIVNDDVLLLGLDELGPAPDQAAALDAVLQTRDPFRLLSDMSWLPNLNDHSTRVTLIAKNLELNPGESPTAVIVRITAVGGGFFDVPAEDVRPIHDFEFTQVVFRLPNNLPVGTRTVTIRAHGRVSNAGTIRIIP